MTTYNSKRIAITINGVGVELLGTDMPTISRSGDYGEVKSGVNGDRHVLINNNVYNSIQLNLKFDSPNIQKLKDLAQSGEQFTCSYKDGNTGEVYNSVNAFCKNIGEEQGDKDRQFTIDLL